MLTSVEQLQQAFAGTLLADGSVEELEPGTFVVYLHPDTSVLEAWRAARDLVPLTGRRPFIPAELDLPELSSAKVADFLATVHRTPAETARLTGVSDFAVEESYVEARLQVHGLEQLLPEVLRQVPLPTSVSVFEEWLYQRVREDQELLTLLQPHLSDPWYSFYVLEERLERTLILLPEAQPAAVAAWLDWFPLQDNPEGRVGFGAVLEQWSVQWGAQVVASDGTIVTLDVQRPPSSGEQAWVLAHQVLRLAGSLQIDRWLLALLLERSRTWLLHYRP